MFKKRRLVQRIESLEESRKADYKLRRAWPHLIRWQERVKREYLHWLMDRGWTLTSGRNYMSGELDYTLQHPRHQSHTFQLEEAIENEEEFQGGHKLRP